jgi:hypothetical protein
MTPSLRIHPLPEAILQISTKSKSAGMDEARLTGRAGNLMSVRKPINLFFTFREIHAANPEMAPLCPLAQHLVYLSKLPILIDFFDFKIGR